MPVEPTAVKQVLSSLKYPNIIATVIDPNLIITTTSKVPVEITVEIKTVAITTTEAEAI